MVGFDIGSKLVHETVTLKNVRHRKLLDKLFILMGARKVIFGGRKNFCFYYKPDTDRKMHQ